MPRIFSFCLRLPGNPAARGPANRRTGVCRTCRIINCQRFLFLDWLVSKLSDFGPVVNWQPVLGLDSLGYNQGQDRERGSKRMSREITPGPGPADREPFYHQQKSRELADYLANTPPDQVDELLVYQLRSREAALPMVQLITPQELASLPAGTELVGTYGEKIIVGQDEIDGDTRDGYLACGFAVSHQDRESESGPEPGPQPSVREDHHGNVNQFWYDSQGRSHRSDGPAYVQKGPDGRILVEGYYQNGQPYRENGLANQVEYRDDGTVRESWFARFGDEDDKLHRDNGPAVIVRDSQTGRVVLCEWYDQGRMTDWLTRDAA